MDLDRPEIQRALDDEDPTALARLASTADLERLKAAESLLEMRRQRKRFGSRFHVASQVLVGYVALLGLAVNAYQSYTNKEQQERQQRVDQERWSKEFDRAQQADKYRAFFETSLLATDAANEDKRLVGYALLEEFVSDPHYNNKATLMLEESLLQELQRHDKEAFDPQHQAAIEAILAALSHAPDCATLERSTRSIERVAQHRTETGHNDEATRLFGLYVRRLIGRAAQVCPSMREFRMVKMPMQDSLVKTPELGGYPSSISTHEANTRIAQLLRTDCLQELSVSAASECSEILKHYATLCSTPPVLAEEEGACEAIEAAMSEIKTGVAGGSR